MKTKQFLVVVLIVASIIGGFANIFGQPKSMLFTKNNEVVFNFVNLGISNNNFLGMESFSDTEFFVHGQSVNTTFGSSDNFVALVSFSKPLWVKKVYTATSQTGGFMNDATVYLAAPESLLYATTESGVNIYNKNGALIDSAVTQSLYGGWSKMVQRNNDHLMATKVVNNKAYLYRFNGLTNQLIDSLLIANGVQFIQSRYYDKTTKSLFITLCLINSTETALVKVNASGVIWQKTFTSTDRSWVTADGERVYVASAYFIENYAYRTSVRSFNMNGDLLWNNTYIPLAASDAASWVKNITIYPNGGCTIVGGCDHGLFAATYNKSGDLIWESNYFTGLNKSALAVSWNSKRELIVGGRVGPDCYVSSYSIDGITSVVSDPQTTFPSSFVLNQNYPNPFNPTTTISYYLPISTQVQLLVCNSLGQVVAELVNGFENLGEKKIVFNADNLSSGVYFIRFKVNTTVLTKKMLLVK